MLEKDLFRRPASWLFFILLSIGGIIFIYFNFGKANSLVRVDIKMDRELALEKAAEQAVTFSLGPNTFKQTVAFSRDRRFQTFVELEAGGLDTFNSCIDNGYYQPFYWKVRHFKEQDVNEVLFWFTPKGEPYGFVETLAEAEKGAALSQEEALRNAEHHAIYNWDVDLTPYELVEKSEELQVSGRVDHTFVYERSDITIGEGKYRIKLVVSGNKLTEVNYFVKIPDDFDRRYNNIRSDNNTIASIASGIIIVFYGLLGVLLGILFLVRRRMLIWKQAAFWGLAIAFASIFLLTLNGLQFSWFGYDTSTSQGNFLLRQILGGLMNALGFGSIIAVSVMAAEGLGRIAFPWQIQLWKIWGNEAGGSKQVLGQTIAGYLFAIIILAIDVLFYVITTTHLDWWSPAGSLSDPNILSNYLPWLDSIAISVQAGFWEEALFRAVPIAGVFILTQKRKSRNLWIILILIVQTLIFGAAHANYPNQPSYARVLEMVVPFAIMGVIYIYYGLLPAIIAHYAVDVFWISLPLWVSSVPGIWVDRIMVIIFLFIPLWVVLYFFIRNKKFNEVPDKLRNFSWKPYNVAAREKEELIRLEKNNYNFEKWLLPAGIIGLVLWLVFTPFSYDVSNLNVSRHEAIEIAAKKLSNKYNLKIEDWDVLTSVHSSIDVKDIFVWEMGGEEIYGQLMNLFLPPPYWKVRFVKTEGEVDERAEEYSVLVTIDGKIYLFSHKLPESMKGANLNREEVLVLVDEFLLEEFGKQRIQLKEISVMPKKLDNRTDWEFVFADTLNFSMENGQGRFLINIAGAEVNKAYPFVHVPEVWMREYRNKESKLLIIKSIGQVITFGLIAFGLVMCIVRWIRKKFSMNVFLTTTVFFLFVHVINSINNWETVLAGYSTQLPLSNYLTTVLISLVITALFMSLFNSIIIGATVRWFPVNKSIHKYTIINALGFGVFVYGLVSFFQYFIPKSQPVWPGLSELNNYIPWLGIVFSDISEIIIIPALMMFIYLGIHVLTIGFTIRKVVAVCLVLIIGFAITVGESENLVLWIIMAVAFSVFVLLSYLVFIRFHFEWLPISFGIFPIFATLEKVISVPSESTVYGAIFMGAISVMIFYYWYRQLVKQPVL